MDDAINSHNSNMDKIAKQLIVSGFIMYEVQFILQRRAQPCIKITVDSFFPIFVYLADVNP